METFNWLEVLGWGDEQINDLRFAAQSYAKQGVYQTALQFFDALAILSPPIAYDLQMVGALYLQQGDSLKALDFFERALKLDPEHAITQLNKAKALFLLGYRKQGLKLASILQESEQKEIASQAKALLLAYA